MLHRLLIALACLSLLVSSAQRSRGKKPEPVRGYTVMAGALGRAPSGPEEIWPNTEQNHLEFIEAAAINLVVVEVPYGVNKDHPRSAAAGRFIDKLQKRGVEVWLLYPHVLAQTFDLPRQVGEDGEEIEWNCCFANEKVQDWLVENGKAMVEAYEPDGLVLFGTFHVASKCHCEGCKELKPSEHVDNQTAFFTRLRKAVPKLKLGTCDFWVEPDKKCLEVIDVYCPVVSIFRPGYEGPGRVEKELKSARSKFKRQRKVPYIKLFLASQTDSATDHVLAAMREGLEHGDGFFLWGYNPGHSYAKQDYDHEAICEALGEMAPRKGRKKRAP